MSTRQTLNMLVRAARTSVGDERQGRGTGPDRGAAGRHRSVQEQAVRRRRPRAGSARGLGHGGIDDARSTRLVVLDPRQFCLLNGIDKETRAAVRAAMGIGPDKMPVQWASSAVFAIVNTQRRSQARGAAVTYLAWERVAEMDEVRATRNSPRRPGTQKTEARRNLDTAVRRAYQHVMYLDLGDEDDHPGSTDHHVRAGEPKCPRWHHRVEGARRAGKAFDVGASTPRRSSTTCARATTGGLLTRCGICSGARRGCRSCPAATAISSARSTKRSRRGISGWSGRTGSTAL